MNDTARHTVGNPNRWFNTQSHQLIHHWWNEDNYIFRWVLRRDGGKLYVLNIWRDIRYNKTNKIFVRCKCDASKVPIIKKMVKFIAPKNRCTCDVVKIVWMKDFVKNPELRGGDSISYKICHKLSGVSVDSTKQVFCRISVLFPCVARDTSHLV